MVRICRYAPIATIYFLGGHQIDFVEKFVEFYFIYDEYDQQRKSDTWLYIKMKEFNGPHITKLLYI